MLKLKKLVLTIGALAIPLVTAVSCSPEKQPHTSNIIKTSYGLFEKKVYIQNIHDGDSYFIGEADASTIEDRSTDLGYPIDMKSNELRLWGVDTPELSNYNGTTWVNTSGIEREWANKATEYVKQELTRVRNKILLKPIKIDNPTYGRLVSIINYSSDLTSQSQNIYNHDIGKELISQGLARVAYIESTYLNGLSHSQLIAIRIYNNELLRLQQDALANHVGIWSLSLSSRNTVFPKAMNHWIDS